MGELAILAPQESSKASEAFADYYAMGPKRSLRKLCALYGRKPTYVTQLMRWSNAYDWQGRIKALAAEKIEQANDYRLHSYVTIAGEYDRRVSDQAMLEVMSLNSLHGIYDRVKPETPKSLELTGPGGAPLTVTIAARKDGPQ